MLKLIDRLVGRIVDKVVDTADAIMTSMEQQAQKDRAAQCPDEVEHYEQPRLF